MPSFSPEGTCPRGRAGRWAGGRGRGPVPTGQSPHVQQTHCSWQTAPRSALPRRLAAHSTAWLRETAPPHHQRTYSPERLAARQSACCVVILETVEYMSLPVVFPCPLSSRWLEVRQGPQRRFEGRTGVEAATTGFLLFPKA